MLNELKVPKYIQKLVKIFECDVMEIDMVSFLQDLKDREDKKEYAIEFLYPYNKIKDLNNALLIKENLLGNSLNKEKKLKEELKEKEVRELETKQIESWNSAAPSEIIVNDKINLINDYVDMCSTRLLNGFFLLGAGGIGKTFIVWNRLLKNNVKKVYCNNKLTKVELYRLLYDYREGHVIVLDNAFDAKNEEFIKILDSALEGLPKKEGTKDIKVRIVSYRSSASQLIDIPKEFIFESTIIILDNKVNIRDERISALLTKIPLKEYDLSYDEQILIMEKISEKPYWKFNITREKRKYAIELIKKNTNPFILNFSLRLLEQVYAFVFYDKDKAEKLLIDELKEDEELSFIYKNLGKSTKEQGSLYIEEFGKGRSTFFMRKKEINKIKPKVSNNPAKNK